MSPREADALNRRLGRALAAAALAMTMTPAAAMAAPADLDTTFDGDGYALAASGRSTAQSDPVVQPDGKILVAGVNAANKAVVERFKPDGTLDTTFGTNGEVVTSQTIT